MPSENRNAPRVRVERGLYIKRGTYYACSTDASGRTVWKSLGSVNLSEARRLRDEFSASTRSVQSVSTKVTVGEIAKLFLAEQERREAVGEIRPGTLRNHREAIKLHLNGLDRRQVATITPDDLVAWNRAQRENGYADWTIRRHWGTLRSVLGLAARRGYAASNPADLLTSRERPKNGKSQVRYLESDEISALLDASKPRYRIGLTVMLFCGLRISELLGLRWQDVSFSEGIVRVTGQVDDRGNRVDFAKTDAGHREVVLMDALSNALKAHKLASPYSAPDDFVMASLTGTPIGLRNLRSRGLEAACTAAGLHGVTCHVLRHTFVSILIFQGNDPVYVAAQAGHENPSVTLDTYSHLFARVRNAEAHRIALDAEFGTVVGSQVK